MLKKIELLSQSSCLNKAGPDEPIFVLRANDPLYAATIRLWAAMAADVHEPQKVSDALHAAALGEKWSEDRLPKAITAGNLSKERLYEQDRGEPGQQRRQDRGEPDPYPRYQGNY